METLEADVSGTWADVVPHRQAGGDIWIRCVTVRQLLEATQTHLTSPFKIDGNELKKFIIVANLCFLDIGPTFTDFGLDDGTGRIKARLWNDNLETQDNTFEVHDFPYLRVTGDLEQYKGRKSVKVTDVRKVSSPYEPYYHILHTIRDTLAYERGPPPLAAVGENRDPRSHARDDDVTDTVELDALASGPSPPASVARRYTRADLTTQSVNARENKSKAPTSGQESPTPLPTTSKSFPISPTQRSRATDVGILEYPGTSHHGNQLTPIQPGRNIAPEAQHGLSSPPSPTPAHARRFIPNDPYSRLTSLQRDVLLCLKNAAAQVPATSSLYPTSERSPTWRGVHVSTIVKSLNHRHPGLVLGFEEFRECIEGLLEEGYIFNPIDKQHYSCT